MEAGLRKLERREWLLWATAITVTLLLTLGLVSMALPGGRLKSAGFGLPQGSGALLALIGVVLLFDIYTVYQQIQIFHIRRQWSEREVVFRLISENAEDMIAVVDAAGNDVYRSPSCQRILGYSVEELQNTVELVHPDDRGQLEAAQKQTLRSGTGHRIEYRKRHKNGNWCVLESTATAVLNVHGQVERVVIVERDATARRRLEEQFRQAQKMEAVGRLSGGVAHDFNNLLGVILGYAELALGKLPPNDPLRNYVDEIMNAASRGSSLTRQLLAFSRQQVLEPKVLDLNAVVSGVEKMLRRLIGEDIELKTVLEAGLGTVKADQGQLEQAIMNLAVNARDAMPRGGKLIIETANAELDEPFVKKYPYPVKSGPYVLLTISDTGIGMDSGTQAHIFEPFFTTKEKGQGTGLGLSMVYGIVKQSGGYIDVYSELGTGTVFKIYLPRVLDAMERIPVKSGPDASLHGTETVLVVEDESSLRILTSNLLRMYGYTVLEAVDGAEALVVSAQHAGPIHLLLADVVLPGIGGRALAEQLGGLRPELKVVYMSGYTGQAVGQALLDPGSIFLQKPFTSGNLARKVREGLSGGRAAAAG